MLNTSYKRRIAAIKAEADVDTGKPTSEDRAGARIRGNLFRGTGGQFQAGPAGQLRQRIEAIREMRKAKAKKPKGGKGKGKPAAEKDERTPQEIANQNRAMIAEATGMADLEGVIVRLGAGMDSEAEKEAHDKLIGQGLAKRNADGSVTLTPAGKAWRRAADKGDQDAAATALAEGKAGVANKEAKDKERADKQEAREKGSGGGSKDKKKPAKEKPEKEDAAPSEDKESAAQAKKESNRAAVAEKMMANDAGVTKKGMDALASLASGEGAVDASTVDALAEMGLAERAKDGTPRLTTQGRAAVRAAEQGDYGAAVDAISRAADAAIERRERDAEQAALEDEAPSDEELVSEAAATVGLEDADVDDLRTAADEGGAANETLQAAGLVDSAGAATAEGVDALEALERGDIRGYRRAARKARARVRREKTSADKASQDKRQAVEDEVARIDTARGRGVLRPTATKAQEQAHTGVMVALFTPELAGLPGVTEPQDDLHITLAYLGNTDDIQLARRKDRLIACLTAWASSEPPLIGVVNGLGRFFNAESDGTNAVYAAPDVASLPDARQRLIRCLGRAGIFAADNHGFTPHITLAYVPSDAPTPDIRPMGIPLALDAAWLAWGDERIAFPFGGATKAVRRGTMRESYVAARQAGSVPSVAWRTAIGKPPEIKPATKMTTISTVADLLTAQIGRERYANAFYTALATWADAEGYDGLKAWADREASAELGHAQQLIAYGRDRDITGLPAIPAPPVSFSSYTTALAQALDLERQVSAALQTLTTTARGVGDEPTALIASDLLRGQVESEKELKTLIQRFERADATTLDLLDHELMEAA